MSRSGSGNTYRFNRAANSTENEKESEIGRVPEMIREDQPVPRPHPPGVGHAVDEQAFNERWRREMAAAQRPDSFDRIDVQNRALVDRFNQRSDEPGQTESQRQIAEDRLAGAIDAYLAVTDKGQTAFGGLKDRIHRLNEQVLREEERVNAMRDNAQALDPPLTLGDAFDQVKGEDRSREQDRGR